MPNLQNEGIHPRRNDNNDLPRVSWERSREEDLSDEQLDRILRDANFIGGKHPYAPMMFDDLCCHVRALLEERERILKRSVRRLRALERIHSYLRTMFPAHEDDCDCARCETMLAAQEAIRP